ncbi:phosphate signaling complex protein PhoU [uncultured Clostridium sp.]|uniref:phosphate signaling complex protein PhoU n=1 Tax=uncultured Clostridium sp. TaxID=59620 RepID=UPI0025F86029|nr:phosphate signaling complex protein PhoU [uncultured Clostridium sp.]
MRTVFEKQLKEINNELIKMGELIKESVRIAIKGVVNKDKEVLESVITSDFKVNEKEKKIERLCLQVLLKQQPVAKDLRNVLATLKMITDMERIGDQAADICEVTLRLIKKNSAEKLDELQEVAKESMLMVMQSLEAFVKEDLDLAREVIKHDDVVDSLFLSIKKELIELMSEKVETGEEAANLLMIAKYFERIGDHSTNIAEWVIFSVTGKHE